MNRWYKDKLSDKKVRSVLGVILACALCAAIFPAIGLAINAQNSESTAAVDSEAADAEDTLSIAAEAENANADDVETQIVEPSDDPSAKDGDADAGKKAEKVTALGAQKVASPTWIEVDSGMTATFYPANDKNATTVTLTGSGNITRLALEQGKSYTITVQDVASASNVNVPAGTTLNLNGNCVLNGTTTVSGALNGDFTVSKGSTLKGNGALSGSAAINGTVSNGIKVAAGKTLSLEGTATIKGSVKGGVIVPKEKTLDLNNQAVFEGTLTVDGTLNGIIKVAQGKTLNLLGTGTLDGTDKNGSVVTVEGNGTKLEVGPNNDGNTAGVNCLTITGGTGSQLHTNAIWNSGSSNHIFAKQNTTAGGAILVRRLNLNDKAELTINNVNITGNHAQGGGGIYIDRDCVFTMNNGVITENTTENGPSEDGAHEGGGIVIAGTGTINKGKITNNTTATETDWGGGGIFIESKGVLDFGNTRVLITNNSAKGLGGGISGCPHAKTSIDSELGSIGGEKADSIVIYGNSATGEKHPNNNYLWNITYPNADGDGDQFFFKDENTIKDVLPYSQDYYCTFVSVIGMQHFDTEQGYSWIGKYYQPESGSIETVRIDQDNPVFPYNTSLGLTAGTPTQKFSSEKFDVVISGNSSTTHGGGIGSNGKLMLGAAPTESKTYHQWSFELKKNLVSSNGASILKPGDVFEFGLYTDAECAKPVKNKEGKAVVVSNGSDGAVRFTVDDAEYLPNETAKPQVYTFYVKELVPDPKNELIDYDGLVRKVEVKVSRVETTSQAKNSPWNITNTYARVDEVKYFIQKEGTSGDAIEFIEDSSDGSESTDNVATGKTFVNVLDLRGEFVMKANKYYYGAGDGKFKFTMQRIAEPQANDAGDLVLASSVPAEFEGLSYKGENGEFGDNKADIVFDTIPLDTKDAYAEDGKFYYWYRITENEFEGVSTDSRVYVVKVEATASDDNRYLVPRVAEVYYADELLEGKETALTLLENDENGVPPAVEFANFGTGVQSMRVYGYAVKAASNEPVEQECFVDPKIIKNLEGRSLAPDEFNFKLIEVVTNDDNQPDWSNIQGDVISETTNDRYGMVDFDKANNVSGDLENPSCLAYTAPGTYFYRVVEANETTDPSIEYSKEIITFTTVIERQGKSLVCTDMYYGHVENGENVRYDESSNPQWHPTITNYAKGTDLQVRKTSALDRDKGLEGATYGLYAVNSGAQADILVSEATSDADGWITFKNVSLKEGTLYYFKERLAPAGHTVSEFRSGFFYLVKDKTAPNGYAMQYTDTKFDEAQEPAEAQADTALVAMSIDDDAAVQKDENAPVGPTSSDGNMLFTYARDGGVYDEATQVDFAKLDTQTHEYVEGAKLAIIDKVSGETVNEWTSGKAAERLEGKLNVDTTYILRETEAPEGYAKADDVEFTIDQYGAVSVLSGTSNGNAEIQGSTITLYDALLGATDTPGDDSQDEGTEEQDRIFGLPGRTGDLLKFGGILVLAAAAIIGLVLFSRMKNKPQHSIKK